MNKQNENAGKIVYHTLNEPSGISYFLYVPRKVGLVRHVLVLVHGISRNAEEIIRAFSKYADDYGTVLVAPLFSSDRFRDFQRLGRNGRGQRADLALQKVIADVNRRTKISVDKIFLYGNSGGGQFAHRYVMAYPATVARYVVSAAGWYSAPDLSRKFPYGFKKIESLPGIRFDIENFLRVPACVIVGEDDTQRDNSLNVSWRIDATQGTNRVDRAKWWVSAITAAARWRGLYTSFKLQTLPRIGHDFTEMEEQGEISQAVYRCLFDKR